MRCCDASEISRHAQACENLELRAIITTGEAYCGACLHDAACHACATCGARGDDEHRPECLLLVAQ